MWADRMGRRLQIGGVPMGDQEHSGNSGRWGGAVGITEGKAHLWTPVSCSFPVWTNQRWKGDSKKPAWLFSPSSLWKRRQNESENTSLWQITSSAEQSQSLCLEAGCNKTFTWLGRNQEPHFLYFPKLCLPFWFRNKWRHWVRFLDISHLVQGSQIWGSSHKRGNEGSGSWRGLFKITE